jgi:hypothetical protein
VTSTGTLPLNISKVALNSSSYAETDSCAGASLPNGATCAIAVTFTPQKTGPQNASLSVSDSAPKSPQSVQLKGKGQ